MKQKSVWQLALLFLLTGIIYACSKDDDQLPEPEESFPPEVAEAKTWFETQAEDGTLSFKAVNGGKDVVFTPDWKKAFSEEDSDYKLTEVPLNSAEPFRMNSAECAEKYRQTSDRRYMAWDIRFVIRTNKETNVKDGFMMMAYPDLPYLEDHLDNPWKDFTYLKRPTDFSGMVFFYNMDGEFVNGWKYVDGVPHAFYMEAS